MAIVKMKKLRVMAMAAQRDALLRELLRLGCVEISEPAGKLSDPAWAPEFWITFINKFLMAFVAGVIMHKVPVIASKVPEKFRAWLAGFCGALTYCVLYVTKNIISGIYVKGFTPAVAIGETLALKLPVTFVNAVIAMACGALLYFALKSPLQ